MRLIILQCIRLCLSGRIALVDSGMLADACKPVQDWDVRGREQSDHQKKLCAAQVDP